MDGRLEEILIANGLITGKMLKEALFHQETRGSNVIQYLMAHGYLKEEELAKCISIQFGYPYLPLRAYEVPAMVIKMVPASIAKKYWLVPLDRVHDIVTLVMVDPFNEEAISEVEKVTGCKVQSFVGVLSDILKAIEKYYGINIGYNELKKPAEKAPLFITTENYTGVERRRSVRIRAKITVHFLLQNEYRKSEIKDVSRHGFLFESSNILPVGSILIMDIDLPREVSPYPIPVIVRAVRTVELPNKSFDVGVEIIRIAKKDLEKIIPRS